MRKTFYLPPLRNHPCRRLWHASTSCLVKSKCRTFGCIDQSCPASLKKFATLRSYITFRKVYITVATSWRHTSRHRDRKLVLVHTAFTWDNLSWLAHSIFNSYVNLCYYLTDIETTFCTLRIDKHIWNNRSDKDLVKVLIHTSRV